MKSSNIRLEGLWFVSSDFDKMYILRRSLIRQSLHGDCVGAECINLGTYQVRTLEETRTQTTPHPKATCLILLESACRLDLE
jgi:hypothetical protein